MKNRALNTFPAQKAGKTRMTTPLILGAVVLALIAGEMFLRVRENRLEEERRSTAQRQDLVKALERRLGAAALEGLPDSELIDVKILWQPASDSARAELKTLLEAADGVMLDPAGEGPGKIALADVPFDNLQQLAEALDARGEVRVNGQLFPPADGRTLPNWIESSEPEHPDGASPLLADVTLDPPELEPIPSLDDDKHAQNSSSQGAEEEEEEINVLIEIEIRNSDAR